MKLSPRWEYILSGSPHNQSLHQEIHFILFGADFWKGLWSRKNQRSITAIFKWTHIRPSQQSTEKLATSCREQPPPYITVHCVWISRVSLTNILFQCRKTEFFCFSHKHCYRVTYPPLSLPLWPPAWDCHQHSFPEFVPHKLHQMHHDPEP